MNALLDFVFLEDARDERAIAHAALIKRHIRIDRGAVAPEKIVQDDDRLALGF